MNKEEQISLIQQLLSEFNLSPLDLINQKEMSIEAHAPKFLDVITKNEYQYMFLHTLNKQNIYILLLENSAKEVDIPQAETINDAYCTDIPHIATLLFIEKHFAEINDKLISLQLSPLKPGLYWGQTSTMKNYEHSIIHESGTHYNYGTKRNNYNDSGATIKHHDGCGYNKQIQEHNHKFAYAKNIASPSQIPEITVNYYSGEYFFFIQISSF